VVQSAGFGRMSDFDLPDKDALDGFDFSDAKDVAEHMDLPTIHETGFAKAVAERTEKALHGAWMAEYQYVHVYEPGLSTMPLGETEPQTEVNIQLPVFLPSSEPSHMDSVGGYTYSHTYDFESVPDHVLREALYGGSDE